MEPMVQEHSETGMTIWSFFVVYGIWIALLFLLILLFVTLMMWPRRKRPGENIS